MLEERLPGHGESVEGLQSRGILLDGSTTEGDPRLLLQIFGQTVIGPVFFEFIQRKKDEGFGERSEEHTSELQSLMRSSYAVFCLKKKTYTQYRTIQQHTYHYPSTRSQ